MEPVFSRFRDEAVRHLENDVVPTLRGESELYLEPEVRPLGDERIQIRDLQFIRRNVERDLELVDENLATDRLVFDFHFEGVSTWSEWSELLVNYFATINCHHLGTPYAIK